MIASGTYYDYLIIGGGIIGLTIAREIKHRHSNATVAIIEKEADVAKHASGRNSGVLHAGFYYDADSLKAKFCRDGNKAMRQYCADKGLRLLPTGKLVVAMDEAELKILETLKMRGDANGVTLHWVTEDEARAYDPKAVTHKKALYSPNTCTVDPVEVCHAMKQDVLSMGIVIHLGTKYIRKMHNGVLTNKGLYQYGYLINAAGLYADKVAHDYGFGKRYTIIPFKGLYMKYVRNKEDIRTNIYPVPSLNNPFLGVHFTKTVDGSIKIGPTAMPAFWRENYKGLSNLKLFELMSILYYEAQLFLRNSFNFRKLAWDETRKYRRGHLVSLALKMARDISADGFGSFTRPGIRAQLLDKKEYKLVQDFVIERDEKTLHVLNAVSPAFTCSIPFATYVVDMIDERS